MLEPEKTLLDARNLMLRYNISRVVVTQGRLPAGTLTEEDIAKSLYSEVPSGCLDEITFAEVISRNLVTVEERADLIKCTKLMLDTYAKKPDKRPASCSIEQEAEGDSYKD